MNAYIHTHRTMLKALLAYTANYLTTTCEPLKFSPPAYGTLYT